jgi:hypothetical protein
MSVEWRVRGGADAIIVINPPAEVSEQVSALDADALKAYLAVTGNLQHWRQTLNFRPIDGGPRDPDGWGRLVVSRADSGQIDFLDPELFWDGVYRWFRSRGVDYNT